MKMAISVPDIRLLWMAMLRYLLVLVCCLMLSGCHYYNKYVKQKFPITSEDEVISLIKRGGIQNVREHIYVETLRESNMPLQSYRVGKKSYVNGYNSAHPLILDDHIVVLDSTGGVYCVDRRNPSFVKWKIDVSRNSVISGALAASKDGKRLFVSTGSDHIIALDMTSGTVLWNSSVIGLTRGKLLVDADKTVFAFTNENRAYAFSQKDGSLMWLSPSFAVSLKLLTTPTAVLHGNKLLIALPDGYISVHNKDSGFHVHQINTKSLWYGDDLISDITTDPLVLGNDVVISRYDGHLSLIGQGGGNLWDLPISTHHAPILMGETMFILDVNNILYSINKRSGRVIWHSKIIPVKKVLQKDINYFGPVLYRGKLMVFGSDGYALRIEPATGRGLDKVRIRKSIHTLPLLINDRLYIYTGKHGMLDVYG